LKLNLGCSDRVIPGYIGVDLAPPAVNDTPDIYQQVDLAGPWPWEDSSVEEVLAYDVCEHIGDCSHSHMDWDCVICGDGEGKMRHPLGRIHFLNELHRVLQPGGIAHIETPNATKGVGFACDPTHVTPWCLSSFKYFEAGTFAHGRLSKSYGITAAFRVISLDEYECSGEDPRERVWKIKAVLAAVKP
jgi:hypothetical protein